MSIKKAIEQIDASTQKIPSNHLANTGCDDMVFWHEVREWLVTIACDADQSELADAWEAGESAGQDNAHAYQTGAAVASNPYRPAK